MSEVLKPNEILDQNDPGDDTLLRYRYQTTCAVIAALQMFNNDLSIDELFCEQFEDYLIKDDKQFIGTQVKTRNLNDPPFSLKDTTVQKMIERFTGLELSFPNQFSKYTIVSNHGFSKKQSDSLQRVIELAVKGQSEEILKKRSTTNKLVQTIIKRLKCTDDDVIRTISKINLRGSFASLEGIKQKLVFALREIDFISKTSPTLSSLEKLSDVLVAKFFEMSSLGNKEEGLCELFISKKKADANLIDSKRIDKKELKAIVESYLTDPITLTVNIPESIGDIRSTNDKLELKMDKGGIDFHNVGLHKDYKYSAQTYLLSLLYKHGSEESDALYNQVRLIVQTECQESYDENFKGEGGFGTEMLKDVRKRIRERIREEKDKFRGLSYEHVLGIASILTEECTVWWSEKFDLT
ncbi:MAG: dsDNA nuclease domain-containing protein [Cytophagales bacterium]